MIAFEDFLFSGSYEFVKHELKFGVIGLNEGSIQF